jgi:hypothetical protein
MTFFGVDSMNWSSIYSNLDLPSMLIGALLQIFIEHGLKFVQGKIHRYKASKESNKSAEALKKYKYLAHGFEIVQHGWENGFFREDQVILVDEGDFELSGEISKQIREPQRAKWLAEGKRDNQQFGIHDIQRIHEVEVPSVDMPSHSLIIKGHRYRYFDSMSTHFTYLNQWQGYEILRNLLRNYLRERGEEEISYEQPIRIFPSPLSVGLSLFCEKGNYIALTRRTKSSASGGHVAGGQIFNAVGENVNHEKDVYPIDYSGKTRISPWQTSVRGLWEEIGINHESTPGSQIKLHSLIWDSRILDSLPLGCC